VLGNGFAGQLLAGGFVCNTVGGAKASFAERLSKLIAAVGRQTALKRDQQRIKYLVVALFMGWTVHSSQPKDLEFNFVRVIRQQCIRL
jgi:hypothetical protein